MVGGKCVTKAAPKSLVEDSEAEWKGVVHAVIGAAGYEFSNVASGKDVPEWVVFANDTKYGFAIIDANATSLNFQFVRSDGEGVLDEFALRR